MKLDINSKRKQIGGLNEISQQAKNTYAHCIVEEDTVYLTGCFYKCRDYFQDSVYKLHTGIDVSQYGFHTSKNEWDGKHMLLWYSQDDEVVSTTLDRMNEFIAELGLPIIEHQIIDTSAGLGTNMGDTKLNNNLHLVTTPEFYSSSLFTASLYTAILRLVWWLAAKPKTPILKVLGDLPNVNERMAALILTSQYKGLHIWKDIMSPFLTKGYANIGMVTPEQWKTVATWSDDTRNSRVHNSSGISCVKHTFCPVVEGVFSVADCREAIGDSFSFSREFRMNILDAMDAA